MASIVNIESMGFDEILADIEKFISIPGELNMEGFHESATMRRFTAAMAAVYNQLNLKLNSIQQESIMHSALKPDSIKYLAQSQLAYHPKRKIAPQHPINTSFTFKASTDAFNRVNNEFHRYSVLGTLSVDDDSYPISIINAKSFELHDDPHDKDGKLVKCRLGIGTWREVTVTIDATSGHLEPYHVFYLPEDKDVIDDSGTIHISLVNTTVDKEPEVISDLYDISNFHESEKKYKVLVTSNIYGGLDVNFGDGLIFGNLLYNENVKEDGQVPNKFTVWYFITPGFIPNLSFLPDNISWDKTYVNDEWFDEKWTTETASKSIKNWSTLTPEERDAIMEMPVDPNRFNSTMANGIAEESTAKIKTLSPYVAMSNNRILTNDDFITRARRIPQIRSCASRLRQIEPGESGNAGIQNNGEIVLPLVPTATFEITGLTYRPQAECIEVTTWDPPPIPAEDTTGYQDFMHNTVIKYGKKFVTAADGQSVEVDRYWLMNARVFQANDTISQTVYMYDDHGTPREEALWFDDGTGEVPVNSNFPWYAKEPYNPIESPFYILLQQHGREAMEKIPVIIWEELEEDETEFYINTAYQPLTQMEWDLNYHTQYNFDTLLGFMRVRVLPPVEHIVEFDLTVVLKQNIDINARSQFEIDRVIKDVINEYCFELGVYLDVGKMVADILKINEVSQCYLHSPIKNVQYATTHYISSKITIKYQTTCKVGNQFHR